MQKGCHTCFSFAYVVLIYTALKKSFVAQPFINLFGQSLVKGAFSLKRTAQPTPFEQELRRDFVLFENETGLMTRLYLFNDETLSCLKTKRDFSYVKN